MFSYSWRPQLFATSTLIPVIFLALCGGTSCSNSLARESRQAVPNEAAIRRVMDAFFAASLRQDWDAAGNIMTQDFEIFTDDARPYGKKEYIELLKADNLLLSKYQLNDLHIGVSGSDDLAWMTYRGYFESTSHGKFSRVATLETLLFRKDSGSWKMFRAQATISDLDKTPR